MASFSLPHPDNPKIQLIITSTEATTLYEIARGAGDPQRWTEKFGCDVEALIPAGLVFKLNGAHLTELGQMVLEQIQPLMGSAWANSPV